jgi:hypothetical protein
MQVIINNFSELILFVSVWFNFICHWQEFEVKKSSVSLLKILTSEDIVQYSSTLRSPRTIMSNFASKYFIDKDDLQVSHINRSVETDAGRCSSKANNKLIFNPRENFKNFEPTERPIPRSVALPHTHAHNDYQHEYPLFDALSFGFVSVEADIWLYPDDDQNLRVAHYSVGDPTNLPTLEELYLDPLKKLKERLDNGGIYADGTSLTLLIDIKSLGRATYERLDEVLSRYQTKSPGLFTTFTQDKYKNYIATPGAVTVIISGKRPREFMERQKIRYANYDGRKRDIEAYDAPDFMPLISDNWNSFFSDDLAWDGTGNIPFDTKAKLKTIVSQVRSQDKTLRFWNLPQDSPNVWQALYEAGVDLINTDDLEGLAEFVKSQCNLGSDVRL